jgi:Condensation domain/Phosphopantetheine attachment site
LLKHDVAIAAADPAVGPRDDVERTIVEIWKAVLKRNRIGIHDDFFRLGGNSLLAIQMVSRVNKTFGSSLAGTLAFECKTVALLAARLDADAGQVLPLERVETSGRVIASYPQQGAWPIANQDAFKTFYNMVNGLWLDGPLDAEALQRSLDRLIARHESLRAHFALAGDDVMMCVSPTITIPIERRDLAAGDDLRASARNEIARECAREFDLMRAPLVRASLFRRSPTQHLFILTIHHLVSDAWSNNLIQKELGAFYADEVGAEGGCPARFLSTTRTTPTGMPVGMRPSLIACQIDYWRRKLAAMAVSEHPFPTDTGAVQAPGPMCYLDIDIAGERYAAITAFARERGITTYVVLMSALHLALLAYSGLSEFMIYSPLAGRPREELEASVGLYVNMIVVVSKTDESATIGDFVRQIGDNIIEAHANSAVSMMAMMRRLEAPLPALPSVVLNVIDLPNTAGWTRDHGRAAGARARRRDRPYRARRRLARMRQGGADVCLGYNTALFRAESGGRLAALFADAIESIVRAPASGLGAWLAAQRR